MRTKITFIVFVLLCIGLTAQAQWISFKKGESLPQQPDVQLISSTEHAAVIEVDVHGVMIEHMTTKEGNCQQINFLNDNALRDVGKPAMPYITRTLAIPDEASVSYEVMEVGDFKTIDNIRMVPGRGSWIEGAAEPEYKFSDLFYKTNTDFPNEMVSISEPAIFRDFRICGVSIFPAQYNAAQQKLKVATRLKVKIKFGDGPTVNKKTTPKRDIAPSFAAIYKHTIFNYNEVMEQNYKDRNEGQEVLLIVVPDDYYDHVLEFAQWKRQMGYEVIVTKFSDIGATNVDPTIIRDYVADLYENAENPPTYLIKIGDMGIFPHKIVVYPYYSFPDEDYFAKVDGEDYIPDILTGRISVQSPGEMILVTKKIINYEKDPYLDDPNWFKKALCCSNNYYESQVETKEFTADIMLVDGGFDLVNEYMADGVGPNCTYTTEDVIAAINDGRSFVNYRGEGWVEGWYPNCTPFYVYDLVYVDNGRMHPFITSIGCGVAQFIATGDNCFGEAWMKMGSISNPAGAINFIGPVSNTHTAENNSLDKGIYMGMFQEGLTTPGQALLRGKMNVQNDFGVGSNDTKYQFNVYCDLGDPSTKIWKDTPYEIAVAHTDSLCSDSTTFTISVNRLDNGAPVNNATVTIVGSEDALNAKTDENGKVVFDNSFTKVETLAVTVSGNNIKPYIGSIKYANPIGIDDVGLNSDSFLSNSPNPFSNSTTIDYKVKELTDVKLLVYDMSGRIIRTLYHGQKTAGNYQIEWDGADNNGADVSSGVYFVSLQANPENSTIRVVKF